MATEYTGPEGARFDEFPYHQSILHKVTGAYTELPGWDEDISGVRSMDDLPQAARDYLAFIEEYLGVPVVLIGVGPGRDQMIWTEAARRVQRVAA